MAYPKDQLDAPLPVQADAGSLEIARVWLSGTGQHFTIRADAFDDPAAWGILLVDLARHTAVAYEQSGKQDRQAALNRLLDGLRVELDSPTDDPARNLAS